MTRQELADNVSRIAKEIGLNRHDIRVLLAMVKDEAWADILIAKLCDLREASS